MSRGLPGGARGDEAGLVGEDDELGAVAGAELDHGPADVGLGGGGAEETGDFVFQGWTVTDPGALADVARHSPIADSESVVRLPARMRQIILEALSGQAATIQRADSGDTDLSRASGDEGRVHAV